MKSGGVLRQDDSGDATTARATSLRSLKRSVVFHSRPAFFVRCRELSMSIVMKFGGTSVADAAALENVARIVAAHREAAPVVVVSAMSDVTDALLASVAIASEGRLHDAVASLKATFERHDKTAQQLLSAET